MALPSRREAERFIARLSDVNNVRPSNVESPMLRHDSGKFQDEGKSTFNLRPEPLSTIPGAAVYGIRLRSFENLRRKSPLLVRDVSSVRAQSNRYLREWYGCAVVDAREQTMCTP